MHRRKNLEGAQTGPPDGFNCRPRVPESGTPSEGSKMRPAPGTRWEYPRHGREGRDESSRREPSSRWTLSNETSIPDRTSPALMRAPPCCSQPPRTGQELPNRSSSWGDHARSTESTSRSQPRKGRTGKQGPKALFQNKRLLEKGEIRSNPIRKISIALKGVKDSSKGSGLPPWKLEQ